MEKWWGLQLNVRWPHDGFNLGIGFDILDASEEFPWDSLVIKCLFVTIVYTVGYGDDAADIYNNQNNGN